MHKPVREGLEEYLDRNAAPAGMELVRNHLAKCPECRAEVAAMEQYSRMLQTLKPPPEVLPAPGFYARVLERIEAQAHNSYWSLFLEPLVARQLVFASLGLLLLFASAALSTGSHGSAFALTPVRDFLEETIPHVQGVDVQYDRTVVLTTLTSEAGRSDFLLVSSD